LNRRIASQRKTSFSSRWIERSQEDDEAVAIDADGRSGAIKKEE
jgi:hypothetical protein